MKIPFADAHCHANPIKGLGARAVGKRFREAGGWFIALVGLPPHHYGIEPNTVDDYVKAYNIVISEANKLRELGLKVKVFVGFHPAEVDEHVRRGRSIEEVIELATRILETIAKMHDQGLVDGIGEVGRQHYSTSPERFVASEIIMVRALEIARDHDMLVHLHLEQGGFATVESINDLIRRVGIKKDHVILHHVTVREAQWCLRYGLWYTVPGKYKVLRQLFMQKIINGTLIESDFIDDPRRPGVSSYPWEIIGNQLRLLRENVVDEDLIYRINVDNIARMYRVNPP